VALASLRRPRFLGFTHICAKSKTGRFKLKRITDSKRLHAKLRSVKAELMRRRHQPIPEQGEWLASVLREHANYYGVPDNREALLAFRFFATEHWYRALRRRSQLDRLTWERMQRLRDRWLGPQIVHPWPDVRFDARTQGRSQCASSARWDLCGGRVEPSKANTRPYRHHRVHSVDPGGVSAARPKRSSPPAWSARLLPDRSRSVGHVRDLSFSDTPSPASRHAWLCLDAERLGGARVGSVQMVPRAATW